MSSVAPSPASTPPLHYYLRDMRPGVARSHASFTERHARTLAGGLTVLGHAAAIALLLWGHAGGTPVLPPPPADRTQLVLLPPRAPEVPLEDIVAPTPSVAATLQRQKPEPPRDLPKTPTRETARWVIPPPAPPQPMPDSPAPLQHQASVAASPPSPPLPPGPSETMPGRDSWEARVMARLERFRRYPHAARARRHEGIVQVRVSLARDGQLLSVAVEQSSGYAMLDQAALETFRRAAPLPVVPDDRPAPVELSFPVEFFIR
ncbi:energy transducer TonB [Stenotrophomonas sp. NPDC047960]|uniref:energy transducer TonB n=1 Tax=Stenotrophomonas sp. NPDC047960 TaxID=3364531 RepID=UPI003722AC0F